MAEALARALEPCLALHQEGNLDAAEEAYRRLLARYPDEPELLHLFGLLRAQQGRFEEGLASLQKAVSTRPDVPLYQFNLATVSLEAGDHDAAIAAFNRCRELSPAYAGVSLGLGRARAAAGRYGLAVEHLEDAILEDPDDLTPLLVLGDLHLRHSFFERAATTYEQLRQRAGDAPEILLPLAQAYESAGDLDRAVQTYRCLAAVQDGGAARENVARLEVLRQARQEAQTLATDLDRLTASIRQGSGFSVPALQNVLARADQGQRIQANSHLARACLERPERYWKELAGVFAERAWMLSGFAEHLLSLQVEARTALGDYPGIRQAYKRAGMEAAKRNDVGAALRHFNAWQNSDVIRQHVDRYEFDFDVLDCIDRMAEPYRLDRGPSAATGGRGGRIRVAYLLRGLTEANSVLVLLAKQYAKHHNPDAFEIAVFCVESRMEVQASPQGEEHVRELESHGCQVFYAPALSRWEDRLLAVAKTIHAASTDLLLTSAVLATLDHYFVMALRPAAKTIGFVHGPMAQFAPPALDWGITATLHTQMEAPCGCTLVPIELDLPRAEAVAPLTRAELGLPADGILLGSAGRPQKFQEQGFWHAVGNILATHGTAHFLAIGVTAEQVAHLTGDLPAGCRERLRFLGWRADYLRPVAMLDVMIDTFPSGGGVVLLDAQAIGVPVVTFENDFTHAHDQTDWSLAAEGMIANPELILPRGDYAALVALIERLLDDPPLRQRIARQCQAHVLAEFGSPARMVLRSEAVFRNVLAMPARTAPILAPPLGSNGVSNLGYWQQIQEDGYFEDHPCYEGLREFGEDEKVILKYTTLAPDMTVVEIGCGYGRDVLRIAPHCRRVYGIDVNDTILAKATKFLAQRNIGNFTPVLAERWEQDIPHGIDLVFTIVVFQHLTKDIVRNYVTGLGRKLSPHGCFICQFAEDIHGSEDAMLKKYEPSVKWTRDEIKGLVADAGLELFALDSSQVTPTCVWHWAHFGSRATTTDRPVPPGP